MTASELSKHVGQEATYHNASLNIRVKILDAREHFGRTDFRVSPVSGSGEQWLSEVNITLDEGAKKGKK